MFQLYSQMLVEMILLLGGITALSGVFGQIGRLLMKGLLNYGNTLSTSVVVMLISDLQSSRWLLDFLEASSTPELRALIDKKYTKLPVNQQGGSGSRFPCFA